MTRISEHEAQDQRERVHEWGKLQEEESTFVERLVSEFRADNANRMKEGVIFPAGDLPGGAYFGLDKELFQVCLEIRAIDWKMAQLRAASALPLSNSATQAELDAWNRRNNKYFEFADMSEPVFESRMRRLASLTPQTLRGLNAKASVVLAAYLASPSDDDTTGRKAVRSTFNDIRSLMGLDQ